MSQTPFECVLETMQKHCAERMSALVPGTSKEIQNSPEGNPMAQAMMLTWEGAFHVVLIHNDYFSCTEAKENLVVFLRSHIRQHRAQAVALMIPMFGVETVADDDDEPRDLRDPGALDQPDGLPDYLGQHPQSVEVLSIWACSQFRSATFHARIRRSEDQPPTLGPWGEIPPLRTDRFAERLQQSIIAVA